MNALGAEGIDCGGCVRLAGARTPISAILLSAQGERTIANYRDKRLDLVTPADPDRLVADIDVLLVDNRYPAFVTPICHAARRRGLAPKLGEHTGDILLREPGWGAPAAGVSLVSDLG